MWDLSSPTGIEPASAALEGGFFNTGPPGKACIYLIKKVSHLFTIYISSWDNFLFLFNVFLLNGLLIFPVCFSPHYLYFQQETREWSKECNCNGGISGFESKIRQYSEVHKT